MKTVLMVAFHYPPFGIGSGVHRALAFSLHLPRHGWTPVVLSADPRAFKKVEYDQLQRIPDHVRVGRAFALDAARHLSFGGRYPKWAALPDRWVTWALGAIPLGLRMIQEERPDVLWTTYPISTAHLIGYALHRLTGVPWVADFRDSMTEPHFPRERTTRAVRRFIERLTVRHCSHAVFTTPGAARMYAERYPELPGSRWVVIQNAYDEEEFARVEHDLGRGKPRGSKPLTLLHSGALYPEERDPTAFFAALAKLKREGRIGAAHVRVVLRASGNEQVHRQSLAGNDLDDLVFLEDAQPYRQALAEMLQADGLLLFQSSGCNHQIPAKAYEYLRANRPILAMTDPIGDTASLLASAGVERIVRLDSEQEIARGLLDLLREAGREDAPSRPAEVVERHTRRARSEELARLLDTLVEVRRSRPSIPRPLAAPR